jgi:hypothetical protein
MQLKMPHKPGNPNIDTGAKILGFTESLVILWHNEFPNLCIGSEYTVIPHKIMSGSWYQSSKFA